MSEGVRKPMWRFLFVWLALAALPATSRAQAVYTATAGMPVRIEIVASCTVTASDLNFGAYSPRSQAPVQGQTAIPSPGFDPDAIGASQSSRPKTVN